MARVRYGPRSEAGTWLRPGRAGPSLPDVWSTGVVALWTTDPDALAAGAAAAAQARRAGAGAGEHQSGRPVRTRRWARARSRSAARHGEHTGWYPLVMPMSSRTGADRRAGGLRRAQEAGRGRPGQATAKAGSRPRLSRHGIGFVEVMGAVTGELPLPEPVREAGLLLQVPARRRRPGLRRGPGPWCTAPREERVRRLEAVDRAGGAPRVARSTRWRTCRCAACWRSPRGERPPTSADGWSERVSAQALLPYVHQRYDDPMQVLDGAPAAEAR